MKDNTKKVDDPYAFCGNSETLTSASFEHCSVDFDGSDLLPESIEMTDFFKSLDRGQDQTEVVGADDIVNINENQKITIQKGQSTTAKKKITITSKEDEICINAATQITLKVGKSEIVMNKDGKIEIRGVNITIKADKKNTIIGKEKVDINPREYCEANTPRIPPDTPTLRMLGIDPPAET
jgi:hypothetical protein